MSYFRDLFCFGLISNKYINYCAISIGIIIGSNCNQTFAMDLRQAYEAAEKNDANIRASRAATDSVREKLPQAFAQRLPNIAFSAGANRNSLTSTTETLLGTRTSSSNYSSNNQLLQLRQPIYKPFVNALVSQADAQINDASASLENDEGSLVLRLSEAYFDALLARAQKELIISQKLAFSAQLEAAEKSFIAGSGMRTDIDEARARLDMSRAQELEALQHVDFTRRRLEVLTGETVGELADLDMERFVPDLPKPAQLDAWIEKAQAANPQLRSLKARLDAAEIEISKARSAHKPTLDAVAGWSRSDSDSVTSVNTVHNQKFIGVQLNVPLYSGGYVNSTVRQAVAEASRARENLEAARRDLETKVYEQYRGVTEGVLRVRALEQAVRSAEQMVQSNRKSFSAGVRTTVDVLNSEQQLTQALRDLAQARYAYLLSQIRLQILAGEDRWQSVNHANAVLSR